MPLKHYLWSLVAASNASADPAVNWAEGQAPSSVNDSARAMMASAAAYRDDVGKGTVLGGTGAAYTLTTNQVFDTLANMDRKMVTFIPGTTNTGACTINVDGLGAKALRPSAGVDFSAGVLIGGTPYSATYFDSTGEWYVHGVFGQPYDIPLAACIPYFGSSAPNTNFALPLGQPVSRSTYSALFALIGTTHGVGDGSTTFNLPDMGGRTFFGKEAVATRLTTAGGGIDGATLGATGGTQNGTILQANLPAVTLATTITDPGHTHTYSAPTGTAGASGSGTVVSLAPTGQTSGSSTTGITASTALGGSGTAFKTVSPGIVGNWIMRVL